MGTVDHPDNGAESGECALPKRWHCCTGSFLYLAGKVLHCTAPLRPLSFILKREDSVIAEARTIFEQGDGCRCRHLLRCLPCCMGCGSG